MTDDSRRVRRREGDDDFGPPLFADDATGEVRAGAISFGDSDTGPLPHWTDPPTGELPRVLTNNPPSDATNDDLDVWTSFSGQGPTWRDDPVEPYQELLAGAEADATADTFGEATEHVEEPAPARREPGRITIGTDPTDDPSRPVARRPRQGDAVRNSRPTRPSAGGRPQAPPPGTGGRDMPAAIAVGVGIAALFIAAVLWRPAAVMAVIVAVLGLAAVEFFDKVTDKGYRPATIAGIVAAVSLPLAAYWVGETALPLVLVFAFAAASLSFIGSGGLDSAPLPNMAITTLAITWIGMMGSFAALILSASAVSGGVPVAAGFLSFDIGTDTLCLLAIGVVANDVGALFVGSVAGRTPLRAWISPHKSIEGLVGGTVATMLAMFLVNLTDKSTTWNSLGDLLLLGLVVSVAAPIGDLTESMFKRNLDTKDFGSLIKGHGGVLDRFDGFLFALPACYYLLRVLEPWVSK